MKKLLVCACFMQCSLASFASYYDYEYRDKSNGFIIFLEILGIVWAILNIILFFKLWRATNNIDKITNKFINQTEYLSWKEFQHKIFILNAKGKKEEVVKLMNDAVEADISKHIFEETNETLTSEFLDNLIIKSKNKSLPYYKALGIEPPAYFDNLTNSAYCKFNETIKEYSKQKDEEA